MDYDYRCTDRWVIASDKGTHQAKVVLHQTSSPEYHHGKEPDDRRNSPALYDRFGAVAVRHAGCFARKPWRTSRNTRRISGKYRSRAFSEGSSPRHSSSADRSCVGIACRSLSGRQRVGVVLHTGGVPRGDVVCLKGVYDGVEFNAKLDVAVADVFGGSLCAAPAMEGRLEGLHVADEVVHDGRDVGKHVWRMVSERSWTSRCHRDVSRWG